MGYEKKLLSFKEGNLKKCKLKVEVIPESQFSIYKHSKSQYL